MVPSALVATATTWPKFHGAGVPAAVVAGSGQSGASVYAGAGGWAGAAGAADVARTPATANATANRQTECTGLRI